MARVRPSSNPHRLFITSAVLLFPLWAFMIAHGVLEACATDDVWVKST